MADVYLTHPNGNTYRISFDLTGQSGGLPTLDDAYAAIEGYHAADGVRADGTPLAGGAGGGAGTANILTASAGSYSPAGNVLNAYGAAAPSPGVYNRTQGLQNGGSSAGAPLTHMAAYAAPPQPAARPLTPDLSGMVSLTGTPGPSAATYSDLNYPPQPAAPKTAAPRTPTPVRPAPRPQASARGVSPPARVPQRSQPPPAAPTPFQNAMVNPYGPWRSLSDATSLTNGTQFPAMPTLGLTAPGALPAAKVQGLPRGESAGTARPTTNGGVPPNPQTLVPAPAATTNLLATGGVLTPGQIEAVRQIGPRITPQELYSARTLTPDQVRSFLADPVPNNPDSISGVPDSSFVPGGARTGWPGLDILSDIEFERRAANEGYAPNLNTIDRYGAPILRDTGETFRRFAESPINYVQGATASAAHDYDQSGYAQNPSSNAAVNAAIEAGYLFRSPLDRIAAGIKSTRNISGAQDIGIVAPELGENTVAGTIYNAATRAGADPTNLLLAPAKDITLPVTLAEALERAKLLEEGSSAAARAAAIYNTANAGPSIAERGLAGLSRGMEAARQAGAEARAAASAGMDNFQAARGRYPLQDANGQRLRYVSVNPVAPYTPPDPGSDLLIKPTGPLGYSLKYNPVTGSHYIVGPDGVPVFTPKFKPAQPRATQVESSTATAPSHALQTSASNGTGAGGTAYAANGTPFYPQVPNTVGTSYGPAAALWARAPVSGAFDRPTGPDALYLRKSPSGPMDLSVPSTRKLTDNLPEAAREWRRQSIYPEVQNLDELRYATQGDTELLKKYRTDEQLNGQLTQIDLNSPRAQAALAPVRANGWTVEYGTDYAKEILNNSNANPLTVPNAPPQAGDRANPTAQGGTIYFQGQNVPLIHFLEELKHVRQLSQSEPRLGVNEEKTPVDLWELRAREEILNESKQHGLSGLDEAVLRRELHNAYWGGYGTEIERFRASKIDENVPTVRPWHVGP